MWRGKSLCGVCESAKDTIKLKKNIQKKLLTFLKALWIVIPTMWFQHIFECKKYQCKFPYVDSTVTQFQFRLSNYKSTHRKFRKKLKNDLFKNLKKLFHEHYCSDGHEGIANWCVTLIDQVEDKKELRKKELYWINKLNTWALVGFNVRYVHGNMLNMNFL